MGSAERKERLFSLTPTRQSPAGLARAAGARQAAGHDRRARWLRRRALAQRTVFMGRGLREMHAGQWQPAGALFEQSVIHEEDLLDAVALTHAAVCLRQLGLDDGAQAAWAQALDVNPRVLAVRAALATDGDLVLPRGVPGAEPTDMAGAQAALDAILAARPA
ncbi:MAG: hypothetical protein QOE11_2653 [Solirubrobacteraceae bacterium]|nr:hypothetical protein [Solirubrobacteraceae bacterium]